MEKDKENNVTYNDELTESQFTKIIDEGGDYQAELEKIKNKKQMKIKEDSKSSEEKSNNSRSKSSKHGNGEKEAKRFKVNEEDEIPIYKDDYSESDE